MPAHRLDRDTSGVVLFGKNEAAARRIEDWFRERKIAKTYLALCLGFVHRKDGVINRALSRWKKGRRPVSVVKGAGGWTASTRAVRIYPDQPSPIAMETITLSCSFMAFLPHEGRTHQIRVHAEAFGHPILGDDQYGNREANRALKNAFGLSRQALHAWRLRTPEGEAISPMPSDFSAALTGLLGEEAAQRIEELGE
jgi:23S rRNA-/tRNA-specific pseudouridylate synthase